jgi:hypothetical protein
MGANEKVIDRMNLYEGKMMMLIVIFRMFIIGRTDDLAAAGKGSVGSIDG